MILNRLASALAAGGVAVAFLLVLGPVSAQAQPQTKDQQGCINALNKSGQKVLATQGKENSSCVKNAGNNKLTGTAQDCLTLDPKGKLGKAAQKTIDGETKKCTVAPAFASTDSSTVNAAAQDEELSLTADVFGAPLDLAIIDASVEKAGAGCQAAIVKGYEKLTATYAKTFNGCKKDELKNGANAEATIAACLGQDPKGKIGKTESKLADTPAKKCVGVDQTIAFPGACSGAASMSDCVDSIQARARCRACQSIALQDGFAFPDCDDDDDGVLNGSCRQCGNSVAEVGEACDEGGVQTATCEADCTLPTCTDGVLNTLAGEECDDGNTNDNDGCTNSCTNCGNGVVTAPEECDDGNLLAGDGCSAGCACSGGSGEFGCQDPLCPDRGQIRILSGTSAQSCSNNGDCIDHSGVCDTGLSRCVSETKLDTGYSGISHGADVVDNVLTTANLVCPGPAGPTCGLCSLGGIDPSNNQCRCDGDNRTTCDEPFQPDADDCGGATCNCYLGGPLPLSAGNTPACVVNRFRSQPTGIVNVDTGEGEISAALAAIVYLGINLVEPCSYCTGDITRGDGVRDGVCVEGLNAGASCDSDGDSPSFPAPGGDGSSLDCFPDPGKNVSGAGIKIVLNASTTTPQQLDANIDCGFEGIAEYKCPCSVCDNDSSLGCTNNSDCSGGGVCSDFYANGVPLPNGCDLYDCTDLGGGNGECTTGPDGMLCDGILRANGDGFVGCLGNADCAPGTIGIDAGACTLVERRKCFLDPIVAIGFADPDRPVGAAAFCVAPTSNGGINTVAGLPGPARVLNEGVAASFCFSSLTPYTPGVGGCP